MKIFNFPFSPGKQSGFSLVELMVVLSVAAILLMIAVPNFRTLIQNQKVTTAVNDFFAAINLTRAEALNRGVSVDMAPSDGLDWNKGWVVFVDKNNDQIPNGGDIIIFAHGPVSTDIVINSVLTDPTRKYLAYNGSGRTSMFGNISFTLEEKIMRRIEINFLGRPRSCNPDTDVTCN